MKKWYVYGKKADFQELGEKLSLDPVLLRPFPFFSPKSSFPW